MNLTTAFWRRHKGLVLVANDGLLAFTAAGRKHFAPRMAKYGFALPQVKTLARFRTVMRAVTAGELEENTRAMERLIEAPQTTAEERALLKRILGAA